jgi:hypothetical protein
MRTPLLLPLALAAVALAAGCGNSIGDACRQGTDCSPQGDRICDLPSPGGYCTIEGCDFGTCPDEAVCVRFFPVTQLDKECEGDRDCSLDEVCVLGGKCAPRSAERRFCMLRCGGHGDCRERYECRDVERMMAHGGEPVPDPEGATDVSRRAYCAPARPCDEDGDCLAGDHCDLRDRTCVAR